MDTEEQISCFTWHLLEFRLSQRAGRTRCLLLLRKPDGIALGDGAHSSSVSVPMHSRVTSRTLPRLINSGLFTFAMIADRTKRRSLFVLVHSLPFALCFSVMEFSIFHFSPPTYFRTSGGRLILEIKGLAREENLNQETHWVTSWILENWKSVNPHPTMNSRLVRALDAYWDRLSQPERCKVRIVKLIRN